MKAGLNGEVVARFPPHMAKRLREQLSGKKVWGVGTVACEPSEHNIGVLNRLLPPGSWSAPRRAEHVVMRPDFAFRTKPYEHQLREFNVAKAAFDRGERSRALIFEQGTGKTKLALDLAFAEWCGNALDAVLVVAPAGVHRQWVDTQLPEHAPTDVPWVAHAWDGKLDQRLFASRERLAVFTVNYESLIARHGGAAVDDFVRHFSGRLMIIADESHRIKNHLSQSCKAMKRIRPHASHRMILTGTPIGKNLQDYWSQINWLDPQILACPFVTAFRAQYCVMGGYMGREVVGSRNVEIFRAKLAPYAGVVRKQDCLDLPEKLREIFTFDMEPREKEVVRALKRDLRVQIADSQATSLTAAGALVKMQAASGGWLRDDDGNTHRIGHSREKALLELLEAKGRDATGKKTVIWCRFRAEISALKALLAPHAVTYYGDDSPSSRAASLAAFLQGDARYFISNTEAGGTGLNLQGGCDLVVYYSNGFNAISRWQSEDRVHRIGTRAAVTYVDMVAKGSIDKMILANLRQKKSISDAVLQEADRWLADDESDEPAELPPPPTNDTPAPPPQGQLDFFDMMQSKGMVR